MMDVKVSGFLKDEAVQAYREMEHLHIMEYEIPDYPGYYVVRDPALSHMNYLETVDLGTERFYVCERG